MPRAHSPPPALLLTALAGAIGCGVPLEVPAGPGEVRLRPGEEIVLDGSGSFDPEGDEITCRWRQIAGPEVALEDADTPWPRFTPTGPGRYEFELVVAGPSGDAKDTPLVEREGGRARIAVDVLPPNRAPRVEVERELRAEPGQWVVLDGGRTTDPDGDVLSFRWEHVSEKKSGAGEGGGLAMFVEMDPFDGRARRVRVRGWREGVYRFRVTVTDALGAEARAETILRVARRDLPPVAIPRLRGPRGPAHFPVRLGAWPHPAGGVNVPPHAVAVVGPPDAEGVYTLDGSGSSDPNGDALEYRWMQVGGPMVRVLRADRELGLACLRLTPPGPGRYRFSLVVSDGVLEGDPAEVEIFIPGAGKAPASAPYPAPAVVPGDGSLVADAGEDFTAEAGREVALDGTARGAPRGAKPLYGWRQLSGPRVKCFRLEGFDSAARPRFIAEMPGQYEFELRVSADGLGWSAPDRVKVTVLAANRPPWIRTPKEIAARGGEFVRIAAAAGDPDGDETSLTWRQLSGERVRLLSAEGGVAFAAPDAGGVALEAIARDSRGGESRAEVAIRVRDAGRAPVAIVQATPAARPGRAVILDGSESYDLEGGDLRYRWDVVGGMLVAMRGADGPRASFRPPAEGEYRFTLVVSAGSRESSPARVTVEVEEPDRRGGGIVVMPVAGRVTLGRPVVLDASRTRAGRLRPRILWQQLAGPAVELEGGRARTVVHPGEVGRYAFEATSPDLTGAAGAEHAALLRFDVALSNAPPVPSARVRVLPAGRSSGAGQWAARVILDGSASRDPEGAPLLYRWVEVGGGELPLEARSRRRARLVLEGVRPGRYGVRLAVTDGERVSRSDVLTFEVPASAASVDRARPGR